MFRNGEAFTLEQLKDGRCSLVSTTRKRVINLCFTSFFMAMKHPHMLPEFPTARAVIGLGVLIHVFDKGKVTLMKVVVQRTGVMAERSVK